MSLWKLIFITAFAIPLGGWQFVEWWHTREALQFPLTNGHVAQRTAYRRWGGIPAGRLTITLPDGVTTVIAEVAEYEMERIPDDVQFHYSGNPNRVVFLQGEDNSFWGILLLWGLPALSWIGFFYLRRRNPKALERIAV